MCTKVAQNHETKEQKAKIPQKFCYLAYSMYLCPRQRAIETGWWLRVGSSLISKSWQHEEMRTVASS